jgi:MFS family permease
MKPAPATGITLSALTVCQALLFTNNAILISLGALAGYTLSPDKRLATLPVTAGVVGGALTTFFASLLMARIGRRAGFTLGALVGVAGAACCSVSLVFQSFAGFCFGSLLFGVYNAFGGYYRFAAAEAAREGEQARAISLVLVGGLAGGVLGPFTSRHTKDALATPYLGSYLSLFLFLALALLALRFVAIPRPSAAASSEPARPLRALVVEPVFLVAVMAAAFGYGIMSLLMTATPLAMGACGHHYDDAATVISLHVVAMFAPSLVTGRLIQRLGVLVVMLAGVGLNLACVAIALGGDDVPHFLGALVLLGVGWNFLYIGGTTLLTQTYRPEERAKAQGTNEQAIFIMMAVSSFTSGMTVTTAGWQRVNLLAIPLVAVIAVALIWFALRSRAEKAAAG